jgi:hypothetical protein
MCKMIVPLATADSSNVRIVLLQGLVVPKADLLPTMERGSDFSH